MFARAADSSLAQPVDFSRIRNSNGRPNSRNSSSQDLHQRYGQDTAPRGVVERNRNGASLPGSASTVYMSQRSSDGRRVGETQNMRTPAMLAEDLRSAQAMRDRVHARVLIREWATPRVHRNRQRAEEMLNDAERRSPPWHAPSFRHIRRELGLPLDSTAGCGSGGDSGNSSEVNSRRGSDNLTVAAEDPGQLRRASSPGVSSRVADSVPEGSRPRARSSGALLTETEDDLAFFMTYTNTPASTSTPEPERPRPRPALRGVPAAPAFPVIPRPTMREIKTVPELVQELASPQARRVPDLALKHIRAYATPKVYHKPRHRVAVEATLEVVERQFPEYAEAFATVRRELGLRESNALRRHAEAQAAPSTQRASSPHPERRSSIETLGEPLPLYASQDPDPGATQLLARRIAAEAAMAEARALMEQVELDAAALNIDLATLPSGATSPTTAGGTLASPGLPLAGVPAASVIVVAPTPPAGASTPAASTPQHVHPPLPASPMYDPNSAPQPYGSPPQAYSSPPLAYASPPPQWPTSPQPGQPQQWSQGGQSQSQWQQNVGHQWQQPPPHEYSAPPQHWGLPSEQYQQVFPQPQPYQDGSQPQSWQPVQQLQQGPPQPYSQQSYASSPPLHSPVDTVGPLGNHQPTPNEPPLPSYTYSLIPHARRRSARYAGASYNANPPPLTQPILHPNGQHGSVPVVHPCPVTYPVQRSLSTQSTHSTHSVQSTHSQNPVPSVHAQDPTSPQSPADLIPHARRRSARFAGAEYSAAPPEPTQPIANPHGQLGAIPVVQPHVIPNTPTQRHSIAVSTPSQASSSASAPQRRDTLAVPGQTAGPNPRRASGGSQDRRSGNVGEFLDRVRSR